MEISVRENNRIIDALSIKTEKEIAQETAAREKALRRARGITQAEIASRSGVSLGSIKRFESSGEISYTSLLKLALVLDCSSDFELLFSDKNKDLHSTTYTSIDQVLNEWNAEQHTK